MALCQQSRACLEHISNCIAMTFTPTVNYIPQSKLVMGHLKRTASISRMISAKSDADTVAPAASKAAAL